MMALRSDCMGIPRDSIETIGAFEGPLELIQFVQVNDMAAFRRYLTQSESLLAKAGAARKQVLHPELVLSGMPRDELPCTAIIVEEYSSGPDLLKLYRALENDRATTFDDEYSLALEQDSAIRMVGKLKILRPLLHLLFPMDASKPFKNDLHLNRPDINATREDIDRFGRLPQSQPFFNVNINKFSAVPPGENASPAEYFSSVSKEMARATGPRVLGLGAYPTVSGKVIGCLTKGKKSHLHDDWNLIQIVYYPRRSDYLTLIPNLPESIVRRRSEVYQRAIQIPCIALSAT